MSVNDLFSTPLKVINIGLQSFAEDMRTMGVECQQVSVESVEPTAAGAPGLDGEEGA